MNVFNKYNFKKYLKGEGIEIGALNHLLKVNHRKCRVTYVDWLNKEALIRHNPTILKAISRTFS